MPWDLLQQKMNFRNKDDIWIKSKFAVIFFKVDQLFCFTNFALIYQYQEGNCLKHNMSNVLNSSTSIFKALFGVVVIYIIMYIYVYCLYYFIQMLVIVCIFVIVEF